VDGLSFSSNEVSPAHLLLEARKQQPCIGAYGAAAAVGRWSGVAVVLGVSVGVRCMVGSIVRGERWS